MVLAVLFHLLPEGLVTLFLLVSIFLLLLEDGCRFLSGSRGCRCLVPSVGDRSADGCENCEDRNKYLRIDCIGHLVSD